MWVMSMKFCFRTALTTSRVEFCVKCSVTEKSRSKRTFPFVRLHRVGDACSSQRPEEVAIVMPTWGPPQSQRSSFDHTPEDFRS